MAVQHKFLAGTAIPYEKSLFFDLLQSGDVYMGFARNEPMWGFASLLKIRQRTSTLTWPDDVMGTTSSDTDKYFDTNSIDVYGTSEVPDDGLQLYIAYINKTDDETNLANYTFIDRENIGLILLDYMNSEWARVRGIDVDYFNYILTENPIEDYDFYIFNYRQDLDSRIQIESEERVTHSSMKYPVRLMYSATSGASQPTTSYGNNLVGDLTRRVNLLGETVISGLKSSFVTDGNGYIEDNALTESVFFLTTPDGVVIQDGMKYVEKVETTNEISMVFSYPLIGEAIENSGRIKITNTASPDKLACFHERFTDGKLVSDNNPPPLTTNYVRSGFFHNSLFDVLGLTKITSSDVKFARRIDTLEIDKTLFGVDPSDPEYETYQGVQGVTREEVISVTVEDNPDTTVEYAITTDQSIALRYSFDLVEVSKTLNSTTPTEEVYRQLFLCYKPKLSDDATASEINYVHDEVFNQSIWGYDLGVMLYVANKVPVYRKYITNDETFTILL